MSIKTTKSAIRYSQAAFWAFSPLLVNAADIVIDGRTQTDVITNGNTTDITTETIHGDNAYNSFRRFDVDVDDEVNLYQPDAANALINIVTDHQVNIDGIVNGFHRGQLSANLIFAASNGIVVGKNGRINTGALTLTTPSQQFVDEFFQDVSALAENTLQLKSQNIPLSADGLVSVRGQIFTRDTTHINANSVDVSGSIANTAVVLPELVNVGDVANDLVVDAGGIYLAASQDLTLSGELLAQAGDGADSGGYIEIRADDITLAAGARVDVSATTATADAGSILVMANSSAILHQGAELLASASAGNGGDIEFSAKHSVTLAGGGFDASSQTGQGGTVWIDPESITVTENTVSAGELLKIEADNHIIIEAGVLLSSRKLADGATDHSADPSVAASGDILLKAPNIDIKAGAQLLAQGSDGFAGGDITLTNLMDIDLSVLDPSQIELGGKTLSAWFGADKTLQDIAIDLGLDDQDLARLLNQDSTVEFNIGEQSGAAVVMQGANITLHGYASDRFGFGSNEAFSKNARANVGVLNTRMTASAEVKVMAEADTILLPELFDGSDQVEVAGFSVDLNDLLQTYLAGIQPPDSLFYIDTQAHAEVTLGKGVVINAGQKATVDSLARVGGNPASTSVFVGFEGINAKAGATTSLTDDAQVIGGVVDIQANTESNLIVNAENTKPLPGANIGLALGLILADTTASTTLTSGTEVSGSAITIGTQTSQSVSNTTTASKAGSSTTMVAVGISDTNNTATTQVGGSVNATDSVSITAKTETDDNKVTVTGGSAGKLGLGDRWNNVKDAASGLVLSTALAPITSWNEKAGDVMFKQVKAGKRNIAGAFGILDTDNNATATITSGATIQATNSVSVNAMVEDAISVHTSVNATSEGDAIGGAVTIVLQDNKAATDVQNNASLISRAVDITSQTQLQYPWEFDNKSLTEWQDYLSSSWNEMFFNASAFNANNAKKGGAAASVNTMLLNNSASALVSDGATIRLTAGTDEDSAAFTLAAKTATNLISLAGKSPINSGKNAIGGSVSVVTLGGTSEAHIGAATIDAAVADSSVTVDAQTEANFIAISESGGYAEKMAIAGSVGYFETNLNTLAGIDSDAHVNAITVNTQAHTDQAIWNVVGDFVFGKGTAAGISVGINVINNTTLAYVGDQTEDDELANHSDVAVTAENLNVSARADGVAAAITVTGAVSASSDSSGGTLDSLKKGKTQLNNGLIKATDWLNNQRGTDSKFNGDGVSGTESETNSEAPKYGIGLSGNASVNEITLITQAELEHARVSANNLTVQAVNHTDITAAGGSAAIVRANASGSKGSAAVAGSVAYNSVQNQTLASISDSVVTLADDVTVQALSGGELLSVAIGAAINASSDTKKAYSAAGSVSISDTHNNTSATVTGSVLSAATAGETVDITAYDQTNIGTGAGALFAGGRGGVGAALTLTDIKNTVAATLNASTLDNYRHLRVDAISSANIVAGAAMASGGTDSSSLAGSFIFNDIGNTVTATVQSVNVTTTDTIDVHARDSAGEAPLDTVIAAKSAATDASQMDYSGADIEATGAGTAIFAVAGQIQAGKNSVGMTLISNEIHNTYQTQVLASTLNAHTVDIQALANSEAIALALGISLAKGSFAGAGSVVLNNTANIISNVLTSSTIEGDGLTVKADDESTIKALAGQVAFSKKAAIGAAVASNSIANNVTSTLTSSDLNSTTSSEIGANNAATIEVIAAAGAAGQDAAVGASIGVNHIANNTAVNLVDSDSSGQQALTLLAQDNSIIRNFTGAVALSSKAAAGAAVTVNTIANTTTSRILGGNLSVADLLQQSLSSSTIEAIAVGLAASGQVGVAGSVAVNTITSRTEASVVGDDDHTTAINASNNAAVMATSNDKITIAAGAAGIGVSAAGIGASVAVNNNSATTSASIDGASVNAQGQGAGATVVGGILTDVDIAAGIADVANYAKTDLNTLQTTQTVHGVAVNAATTQNIDTIAVTAGVGQYAGIAATVVVNSLGGATSAKINNAQINQGTEGIAAQQVNVTATDISYGNNFVGAIGAGMAGLGAASDNQLFSHTTTASLTNSEVKAQADVDVSAAASQAVTSTSLGGAGGGGAVAASGSVILFDANAQALANNSTITANQFGLDALSFNDFYATDASLAIGGTAASAVWTVVQNDGSTAATATGSTLNIASTIDVAAHNTTELNGISAAGAGAGGLAFAGMGAAYDLKNTTQAGLYNSDSNGRLDHANVTASDTLLTDTEAGVVAVGGTAGMGASALVTTINNQVLAEVVDSALNADTITVKADTDRDMTANSIAGAAGPSLGIAGTALVTNLGSERSDEANQEVDNGGSGTLEQMNEQSEADKTSLFTGTQVALMSEEDRQDLAAATQASLKAVTPFQHETKASVRGSQTVTANSISVLSTDKTDVQMFAGAAAIGGVAAGAAVIVSDIKNATQAELNSTVEADQVTVTATAADKNKGVDSQAVAGTAGLLALGAAVVVNTLDNQVSTLVGGSISGAGQLHATALDTSTAGADLINVSAGVAGVGAVVADVDKTSHVTTTVNANLADFATVNLLSNNAGELRAEGFAAAGGLLLAGSAAVISVAENAVATTAIGDNIRWQNLGAVTAEAKGTPSASSTARGVSLSVGVSAGGAFANANSAAQATVSLGNSATIEADSLAFNASLGGAGDGVSAESFIGSGGIASITGTEANAKNLAGVTVDIGDNATLDVASITFKALEQIQQDAHASGVTIGGLAVGSNTAKTVNASQTLTQVGKNFTPENNQTLTISAETANSARALTLSGAGGLIAGVSSTAETASTGTTQVSLGGRDDGLQLTTGVLTLKANRSSDVNSRVDSTSASLAGMSGAFAKNTVVGDVTVDIAKGANIVAEQIRLLAENTVLKDWWSGSNADNAGINAESASGGALDAPAAESESLVTLNTQVVLGDGDGDSGTFLITRQSDPLADSGDSIDIRVLNDITVRDKAVLNSGGLVSIAKAASKITATGNASVVVGEQVGLTADSAGQNIHISALNQGDLNSNASADSYGLAGAPEGDAWSIFNATNSVDLATNSLILANKGSVFIGAGEDDQSEQIINARARVNLWNKTAIPISTDPDALANIASNSTVILRGNPGAADSGANVLADQDIVLYANKGQQNVDAKGTGKDLYREALGAVASGISEAFGGDKVSLDIHHQTNLQSGEALVQVDGHVEASLHRKQHLYISDSATAINGYDAEFNDTAVSYDIRGRQLPSEGANTALGGSQYYVVKATDGITYDAPRVGSILGKLEERIAELRRLQSAYSNDQVAVLAYAAEIQFLEKQKEALGLSFSAPAGDGSDTALQFDSFFADPARLQTQYDALQQQYDDSVLAVAAQEAAWNADIAVVGEAQTAYTALQSAQSALNAELQKDPADQVQATIDSLTATRNNRRTDYNTQLAGVNTVLDSALAYQEGLLDPLPAADSARLRTAIDGGDQATIATTIAEVNAQVDATAMATQIVTLQQRQSAVTGQINGAAADVTVLNTQQNYLTTTLDAYQTSNAAQLADVNQSLANFAEDIASLPASGGPIGDFLTVHDIYVPLGNVRVKADNLTGQGELWSPGDAEVKVDSSAPMHMTFGSIRIDDDGGYLYYNDGIVDTVADINGYNKGKTAALNVVTGASDWPAVAPSIDIQSHYNPLNTADTARIRAVAPDMRFGVSGAPRSVINNAKGGFSVLSEAGSLYFDNTDLLAGTVNIKAKNGNFVQSYAADGSSQEDGSEYYHVAGDPGNGNPTGSGIISNGDVFLAARYLNINGTIQSGIERWAIDIPQTADLTFRMATSQLNSTIRSALDARALGQTYTDSNAYLEFGSAYAEAYFSALQASQGDSVEWNAALDLAQVGAEEKLGATLHMTQDGNSIQLDGVEVNGGYIQVLGQILNTSGNGQGKLRVLDGYGQIRVDNQSELPLFVNSISTGRGVEGIIDITDIREQQDGKIKTLVNTVYRRLDGVEQISSVTLNGITESAPDYADRTWSTSGANQYLPKGYSASDKSAGQWYVWTTGTDFSEVQRYRITSDVLIGVIDVSTALSPQYLVSTSKEPTERILDNGTFLLNTLAQDSNLKGAFSTGDLSISDTKIYTTGNTVQPHKVDSWNDCNWWTLCIASKRTEIWEKTVGKTDITKYADYASNPIAIEFIGDESGGAITINSNQDVILQGNVVNGAGRTQIDVNQGSILVANQQNLVQTGELHLTALNHIGSTYGADATDLAASYLNVDLGQTGNVSAVSQTGNVQLRSPAGQLTLGGISAGQTADLAATGAIQQVPGQVLTAQRANLHSASGAIGRAEQMLEVRLGATVNSDTPNSVGIRAQASGDIYLSHQGDAAVGNADGHLLVDQIISTGGDVVVHSSGDIIDNNPNQDIDQRTWDQLVDYWNGLALLEDTDNNAAKQEQTLANFAASKTQEYRSYWRIRNTQADPSQFDSSYQYQVTEVERNALTAAYTKQNAALTAEQIDNKITAYADERTAYYHRLDGEFAQLPGTDYAAYNDEYHYNVTESDRAQLLEGSSWSKVELGLALKPGALKELTDTNPILKAANVQGNTVTLVAGETVGDKGLNSGTFVIEVNTADPASTLAALTNAEKVALASAELGDISITDNVITVTRHSPLVVATASTGSLDVSAANHIYLASETALTLNQIQAQDVVSIKSAKGLLAGSAGDCGANVCGQQLILEAGEGGIASAEQPLWVNAGAGLTARGREDIYINAVELPVQTVYSADGAIVLTATGSITDALESTLPNSLNLLADDLRLTAGLAIGAVDNSLEVATQARGSSEQDCQEDPLCQSFSAKGIQASAGTDLYLAAPAPRYLVTDSLSAGGSIRLVGGHPQLVIDGLVQAGENIDIAASEHLLLTGNALIQATNGEDLTLTLASEQDIYAAESAQIDVLGGNITLTAKGVVDIPGIFTNIDGSLAGLTPIAPAAKASVDIVGPTTINTSGSVVMSGRIAQDDNQAGDLIVNSGELVWLEDLDVAGAGDLTAAESVYTNNVRFDGSLTAQAPGFVAVNQTVVGGDLSATEASSIAVNDSQVQGGDLEALASDDITVARTTVVGGDLVAEQAKTVAIADSSVTDGNISARADDSVSVSQVVVVNGDNRYTVARAAAVDMDVFYDQQGTVYADVTGETTYRAATVAWNSGTSQGNALTMKRLWADEASVTHQGKRLAVESGWGDRAEFQTLTAHALVDSQNVNRVQANVQFYAPGKRYRLLMDGTQVASSAYLMYRQYGYDAYSPLGHNITLGDYSEKQLIVNSAQLHKPQSLIQTQSLEPIVKIVQDLRAYKTHGERCDQKEPEKWCAFQSDDDQSWWCMPIENVPGGRCDLYFNF